MLPDYPNIKSILSKHFLDYIFQEKDKMIYPFSEAPRHKSFEGNLTRYIREDGTVENSKYEEYALNFEINLKDINNLSLQDIFKKLQEIAYELAKKEIDLFNKAIDHAATNVGNKFDIEGEPLQVEHFFRMLDKIHIEFDKDGKPIMPSIIAGKSAAEAFLELSDSIESTPDYKVRYEQLIEKKRMEWNDRETARKLVG